MNGPKGQGSKAYVASSIASTNQSNNVRNVPTTRTLYEPTVSLNNPKPLIQRGVNVWLSCYHAFFYNENNENFIACIDIYVQDGFIWLHFIGGNHISCIWPGMADLLLWSYYWL